MILHIGAGDPDVYTTKVLKSILYILGRMCKLMKNFVK